MSFMGRIEIVFYTLILFGFSQILRSQTPNELYQLSVEQTNDGKYTDALVSIKKAILNDSINADYYLQRATIYFNLTKYDDAVKDCYSSLKIEPDKPQVYYLRGQICLVTESYGGSILFFGKTIKFAKNNDLICSAHLNRGKAYFALGKISEAHDEYLAASEINPKAPEILIPLAESYFRLKNSEEALATLSKATSLQPDNPQIYELLGRILIENKDYTKAIEAINKFCSLKPNNAKAYNLLAQTYYEMKEFSDAIVAVNHAITLDPGDPLNYKIKGSVLLEKGQTDEGCNCLFKAMQMGYLEKCSYDLLDYYQQKCEKE